MTLRTASLILAMAAAPAMAAPLQLDVYNPQEQGIFPVSSTLISGPHQAILVDAQFSVQDGEKLVALIKASGKQLKQIIITSGDPDFYFGLEPIVKAFPQVSVVASPAVVKHIKETKAAKLSYWGPQMKAGAPEKLIVPQVTHETRFSVDGEAVELRHADSYAAYLWIPTNKAILGGTGISSGIHLWTADTQSAQRRESWRQVLTEMQQLRVKTVIPGHYIGERPQGDAAVSFTLTYLQQMEKALAAHRDSAGVIKTMTTAWQQLAETSSLELSAKVLTGEMKW